MVVKDVKVGVVSRLKDPHERLLRDAESQKANAVIDAGLEEAKKELKFIEEGVKAWQINVRQERMYTSKSVEKRIADIEEDIDEEERRAEAQLTAIKVSLKFKEALEKDKNAKQLFFMQESFHRRAIKKANAFITKGEKLSKTVEKQRANRKKLNAQKARAKSKISGAR